MTLRIGLISTTNNNIGDDLIRAGIIRLLDALPYRQQTHIVINKHRPLDVFWPRIVEDTLHALPGQMPGLRKAVRLTTQVTRSAASTIAHHLRRNALSRCDLIVQCGTPVFFDSCHSTEWARPLWKLTIGEFADRIPVLNLAAGACYPLTRIPQRFSDPRDRLFIQQGLESCRLTTCRDTLASTLCAELGYQTPTIPCTAFLAGDDQGHARNRAKKRSTILVNFMQGGGHYEWGQGIDAPLWERRFTHIVTALHKLGTVVFLAHSRAERETHERLFPGCQHFEPSSPSDYFAIADQVRLGFFNRLHAAVAWAGVGVPSLAVGTDTRIKMVEELGLPTLFVSDCSPDIAMHHLERLWQSSAVESERLGVMRAATFNTYLPLIQSTL